MTSSESPEPRAPDPSAQDEAQRAADGLKDQIAAVRHRVREARETLTEQARREQAYREKEGRTFKR